MCVVNVFLFYEDLENLEERVATIKFMQFWVNFLSVAETQVLQG